MCCLLHHSVFCLLHHSIYLSCIWRCPSCSVTTVTFPKSSLWGSVEEKKPIFLLFVSHSSILFISIWVIWKSSKNWSKHTDWSPAISTTLMNTHLIHQPKLASKFPYTPWPGFLFGLQIILVAFKVSNTRKDDRVQPRQKVIPEASCSSLSKLAALKSEGWWHPSWNTVSRIRGIPSCRWLVRPWHQLPFQTHFCTADIALQRCVLLSWWIWCATWIALPGNPAVRGKTL